MERWRKATAWAVVVGAWGILLADKIDKAKSVIDAPGNVAWLWGFVRSMFSFTPGATAFLLLGAVALVIALWRPTYTQFVRSRLSSIRAHATPRQWSALTMADKPKNVFQIGDNNEVSNVHVGDVNQAPVPELRLGTQTTKTAQDGTHLTLIPAEVVSPYPPGSLLIEAWGENITNLDVMPQRIGTYLTGHCGLRADHAFHTVMHPFGRYVITVHTRARVPIEIRHGFDLPP